VQLDPSVKREFVSAAACGLRRVAAAATSAGELTISEETEAEQAAVVVTAPAADEGREREDEVG